MAGDSRFWLLFGVLISVAWAQSPPTASQQKFPEIARQAQEAFNQNHFEDAANLYRQAVHLHPKWTEGWGFLAAAEFSQERYKQAAEAYRQTTLLTPNNGPSWAYLGFCEYELRDYRHAFDHLMQARKLGLGDDPGLVSKVRYEVAILWDTAGQFEMGAKELAVFAKASDEHPAVIEATGLNVLRLPLFPYEVPQEKQDLVAKAGQAAWNMNGGHIEEARKIYADLLTTYPQHPNLHYAYAFVVSATDQEAGVAELEKELEISPHHVPAMVEAALLCLELGHLEKSEKLARQAIALEPKKYAPHNILGRILVQKSEVQKGDAQKGEFALGIAELETAVRLAPAVAVTHFNLGQAYKKAGNNHQAAEEFAKFTKLSRGQEPPQEGPGKGNDAGANH